MVCRNCHQSQSGTTHPVNVLPPPGMIIPPEYPTLADGRITCASCHSTHSSDYEYLAIRAGKRELCVGCHKDML
jgi:predicted CXXCH cytochrome family protein